MSEKEIKHAADKFKSGKTHATEAAHEFKDAAAAKFSDLRGTLNERAGEYRERANQVWSETTGRASKPLFPGTREALRREVQKLS